MSDYYATLKIQQGRLKAAMKQLGIERAIDLTRLSGANGTEVCKLMNFRLSARTKSGQWRTSVLRICKALGAEPDDLFPQHLDHEIPTNEIGAFVEAAQLAGREVMQIGPGDEMQTEDVRAVIDDVLGELKPMERGILKSRVMDGKTAKECGRMYGMTPGNVWMIEQKALRKLRHPSRLDRLAEAIGAAGWGGGR